MIADYHWVDLGLRRNLQETTLSLLWSPEFGRNIWISGFPWVSCKSSLNKPTSERLGSLSQVFVGGFKHQLKGLCLRSCRIQECGNLYFYGPIVCPKKFSCADTDKLFDISMLPSIRNQHDLASFFSKVYTIYRVAKYLGLFENGLPHLTPIPMHCHHVTISTVKFIEGMLCIYIWVFPKIGGPPNHPKLDRFRSF